MKEELEPFVRHGTREERIEVGADDVLNAIAEGRDIDIRFAVIKGDLNIRRIADRLEQDEYGNSIIQGNTVTRSSEIRGETDFTSVTFRGHVEFSDTTFSGFTFFSSAIFNSYANFNSASFRGDTAFSGATFIENAQFVSATFRWGAYFCSTTFIEDADFSFATFIMNTDFSSSTFSGCINFFSATFIWRLSFSSATMKRPAGFAKVRFCENTVFNGLWNNILHPVFRPIVELLTIGKVELLEKPVTDFSEFNTTTVMDGSTNPYLKRYIDDEQWISFWRKRDRFRKFLFILWELTSHCGRSVGLWVFWSVVTTVAFAFIYRGFGCDSIVFNVDKLNEVQPGFWGYLYYSVVTFTTLGFGDIVPLTNWARLAVGAEVVLGYVMLGGLISIFANKFARRS